MTLVSYLISCFTHILLYIKFRPFAIRMAHEHSQGQTMEQVLTEETWLTYSQRNAQMWSTKTGQYRRMRQEWRQNVVLGRSRIQGLGLFVKRDIEEVIIFLKNNCFTSLQRHCLVFVAVVVVNPLIGCKVYHSIYKQDN